MEVETERRTWRSEQSMSAFISQKFLNGCVTERNNHPGQSSPSKASRSDGQEPLCHLWNPKAMTVFTTDGHRALSNTLTPCFFKIHLILLSIQRSLSSSFHVFRHKCKHLSSLALTVYTYIFRPFHRLRSHTKSPRRESCTVSGKRKAMVNLELRSPGKTTALSAYLKWSLVWVESEQYEFGVQQPTPDSSWLISVSVKFTSTLNETSLSALNRLFSS